MDPLPNETNATDFTLSWSWTDAIGEIESYTVFISEDGGGFAQLISIDADLNITINSSLVNSSFVFTFNNESINFTGGHGKTYGFICIAEDTAGNVEIQAPAAEATVYIEEPSIICGNVDGDCAFGCVNVADLTYLVAYLFLGGPEPIPELCVGNVDGIVGPVGPVDVADLTYLVAYLFQGGPGPVDTCCSV
jgi:hypothetical protein